MAAKATAANPMVDQIAAALVEIPVLPTSSGYARRRVPLDLSTRAADTLRNVTAALRAEGRKLDNGQPVNDPARAIEWILEQIKA